MYLTRHGDLIADIDLTSSIYIIGAGSIGSYACLALAKLGFNNITVFDDGVIEEENIAPQFYQMRDIGKFKVEALKKSIRLLTGTDIIAVPTRLDKENCNGLSACKVLIMAVDSMSARKEITYHIGFYNMVDARMAIEFLTVISFKHRGSGADYYVKTLFSDSDAVQEACTNKAISYTSLIAGGLVAKKVIDLLKNTNNEYMETINFDINNFDMVRL